MFQGHLCFAHLQRESIAAQNLTRSDWMEVRHDDISHSDVNHFSLARLFETKCDEPS